MTVETSRKSVREAAILLRSLPAVQRTRLLGKLEPQQAAAVVDALNRLEQFPDDEQETVLRAFMDGRPEQVRVNKVAPSIPFGFLVDRSPRRLLELLADESPQAIALVLSYLPTQKAADVLAKLSPERQIEVVMRLAATGEVSAEVIQDVEGVLRNRMARPRVEKRVRDGIGGVGGVSGVVKILNVMEPPDERRLLDTLAEADPELIRKIRYAMFGADVVECAEWPLAEAAG